MDTRASYDLLVAGTINWDTLLFVKKLPCPGDEVRVSKVVTVPGGKGANTAVSAARILGHAKVALLATLGNDAIAKMQLDALRLEGVGTEVILKSDGSSGRAFVAIDTDGQDMILTEMAANRQMDPKLLSRKPRISQLIRKSRTVVIMDPPLNAARWIARQAKRRGALLILSPALLTHYGLHRLRNYLALADCIIVNEQEASTLLGSGELARAPAALSRLLGGTTVIVTLGRRGCAVSTKGKSAAIPTIDLSDFGRKITSTAGAGDAFVGSFAAFKTKGLDDVGAILRANISAALKTTKTEIRGSPRLQEIERFARTTKIASIIQNVKLA